MFAEIARGNVTLGEEISPQQVGEHSCIDFVGFDGGFGDDAGFLRIDERNVHVLVERFIDMPVEAGCLDGDRRAGEVASELLEVSIEDASFVEDRSVGVHDGHLGVTVVDVHANVWSIGLHAYTKG